MINADMGMSPLHVGDNLVDIQIRFNPKIRIWIPDYFWLRLDALAALGMLSLNTL